MTNFIRIDQIRAGAMIALADDAQEAGGHGATFFEGTLATVICHTGLLVEVAIHGRHATIPAATPVKHHSA